MEPAPDTGKSASSLVFISLCSKQTVAMEPAPDTGKSAFSLVFISLHAGAQDL